MDARRLGLEAILHLMRKKSPPSPPTQQQFWLPQWLAGSRSTCSCGWIQGKVLKYANCANVSFFLFMSWFFSPFFSPSGLLGELFYLRYFLPFLLALPVGYCNETLASLFLIIFSSSSLLSKCVGSNNTLLRQCLFMDCLLWPSLLSRRKVFSKA